jgi:hypothetical protein
LASSCLSVRVGCCRGLLHVQARLRQRSQGSGPASHHIAHGWEGSSQLVLLLRPPFYSTVPVIWASWAGSGRQHGIRRGLACHGSGLGTVGRDIQILASVPRLVLSIPVDLNHGGGCLSVCLPVPHYQSALTRNAATQQPLCSAIVSRLFVPFLSHLLIY